MNEQQKETDWLKNSFQDFEKNLNGQKTSSIHQIRKEAFSKFEKLGLPSSNTEDWKYTNISKIAKQPISFVNDPSETKEYLEKIDKFNLPQTAGPKLVFINGHFSRELSQLDKLPTGLTIKSFAEVIKSKDEYKEELKLLEENFSAHAKFDNQALVALNTAFVLDGFLFIIDENKELNDPIDIIFATTSEKERIATNARLLIIANENSRAKIIETHINLGENTSVTSCVSEVVLKKDAYLDHYRLLLENYNSYHLSNIFISQDDNSNFRTHAFCFGGGLVRNEINPVLNGEFVETTLNGLSVLNKEQHVDNHTVIDHAKPNSQSNELYKGIYAGKSTGVFNGTIIVRPDAQKTNAIQSNQSILLSDDATINAKPQLKIWADDVKCTHGATIGQIDEEALFYLRSRGINKDEAKNLLVRAFSNEIVEEIEIDEVKNFVENLLFEKLEKINNK